LHKKCEARFEAAVDSNGHFKCDRCGRIYDLDVIVQLKQPKELEGCIVREAATLKEVPSEGIDGKAVVTSVLADYEVLIRDLRAAIKEAQDIEDEVSADLLIGLLAKYEKNVWMLEAYLK